MLDLGVIRPGSTIRIPFSSFDKDDGSSITMTNYAVADILIYKNGSTTERASTAGFTATTDFDSKTGKHLAIIDLADNTTADFFNAGAEYHVALDAVTVDAVTVGGWIARFRIGYAAAMLDTTIATLSSQTSFTLTAGPAEDNALKGMWAIIHDIASAVQLSWVEISAYTGSTKTVTLAAGATFTASAGDNISIMMPSPLRPATPGRTAVVDANGLIDANTVKAGPTGSGTAQTARDLGASVLLSPGTGTGQLDITSGVVKANAVQLLGTAWLTPAVAGTPDVNAKQVGGTAQTGRDIGASVLLSSGTGTGQLDFTSGVVKANIAQILGTAITETAGQIAAAFKQFFDVASPTGTMKAITNVVTTTTATNLTTNNDKTGYGLSSAAVQAIWDALTSALTTVGSIGKKLADWTIGTAQTGDSFARLGAPAGASVSADIVAVKAETAALKAAQIIQTGTAAAGAAGTITIQTALGADTLPVGCLIAITGGTGIGQCRVITGYVNSTKVVTVGHNWTTNPDNTSVYYIINADAAKVDSSLKVAGVVLTDTVTTYTGNTPQTGDVYPKVDTEVATVVTAVADIQGRLPAALGANGNIKADVRDYNGTAGTFASGRPEVKVNSIAPDAVDAAALKADAVNEIADQVWDEVLSGHLTAGSTGNALNSAGSAGDPWGTALPGAYGAGTAGKIIGDNINATVSSRASQTSVDDIPTNAELATALGTADDAVLAAIAALNNLSQANIRTAVGLATANLDTQLDALPTNAELATALAGADDATLAAIAALNNLSSAQIQTAAAAALAAYDPPTRAEATSDKDAIITEVNANETKIDTLQTAVNDVPTNAELATALDPLPTAIENADALLKRDMSAVTGEATRSPLNALRPLINKVSTTTTPGSMDVFKEDDSTLAYSKALTTDVAAEPIVEVG